MLLQSKSRSFRKRLSVVSKRLFSCNRQFANQAYLKEVVATPFANNKVQLHPDLLDYCKLPIQRLRHHGGNLITGRESLEEKQPYLALCLFERFYQHPFWPRL